MIVNTARFVTSSPEVGKCPDSKMHEYAFIGRSNVGKSSLINMLTGKADLAKTSATPGKTMLINHFVIDDSWQIVDLPGYGYAQRSKADRVRLEKMIKTYILDREQMTCLFLLIDGRLKPQRIDIEFMDWLGENGIPFAIVFTKLDKLSSTAAKKMTADYCASLLDRWEELPPVFRTSSRDRRGRNEILDYIEEMNRLPLYDSEQTASDACSSIKTDKDMDSKTKRNKAEETYPGVAIDTADNGKVDEKLEREATCTLNNNPRSNEIDG